MQMHEQRDRLYPLTAHYLFIHHSTQQLIIYLFMHSRKPFIDIFEMCNVRNGIKNECTCMRAVHCI